MTSVASCDTLPGVGRLEAITRVLGELAQVRELRLTRQDALEGLMLAEMDWLEELHRLLHAWEDG